MALCIVLNCMSTGMDMAALCPRWVNIRRGCFVLTAIGIAICPWNFVNQVTTFITVLSGWSIFLSGMTGILIFDYFLVRKRQLHTGDMYKSGRESAYWYTWGVNFRAVFAWAMGVWPLLREAPSLLSFEMRLTVLQLGLSVESKARQPVMAGITAMILATSLDSSFRELFIGACI